MGKIVALAVVLLATAAHADESVYGPRGYDGYISGDSYYNSRGQYKGYVSGDSLYKLRGGYAGYRSGNDWYLLNNGHHDDDE